MLRHVPLLLLVLASLCPAHLLSSGYSFATPPTHGPDGLPSSRPLIIGHRGSSGMFPEHTRLAYEKAAEQGADVIECDVTITKDLELVCSHEPWIDEVTNLGPHASSHGTPHADFTSRRSVYQLDDGDAGNDWNDKGDKEGYFTFDFTLAELKTLKRRQARDYRDPKYDWLETFVSFNEFLNMSKVLKFGVYPEIKLAAATNRILSNRGHEVTLEQLVIKALNDHGFHHQTDPVFVQSFELETIEALHKMGTELRLIMLVDKPFKVTNASLDRYRELGVYGVGVDKDLIVYKGEDGHIVKTDKKLMDKLHSYGFKVHAFTFRNEPRHLTWDYGQDMTVEYEKYLDLGLDGYFTDFPGSLSRFMRDRESERLVASEAAGMVVGSNVVIPERRTEGTDMDKDLFSDWIT